MYERRGCGLDQDDSGVDRSGLLDAKGKASSENTIALDI